MERDADEKPALQEEEFLSGRSLLVAAGFSCFLALQTYCGLQHRAAFGARPHPGIRGGPAHRVHPGRHRGLRVSATSRPTGWRRTTLRCWCRPWRWGIVPFVAKAAVLSFGFDLGMAALVTWAMLGVSFAASGFLWCLIMSQNSLRQNVLTVAFSAFFSVMIYVATCAAEPKQLGLVGMAIVIVAELAHLQPARQGRAVGRPRRRGRRRIVPRDGPRDVLDRLS